MSTFPSVLSSFTNPLPTNRLNSPSHSSIETAQNSGISQVEAVIGVEGASSVVGTLQYLVKSPASGGGGHVQGAAFGGTGQTTFTKGNLLVAQSASVLAKLAPGNDGQILSANSGASAGVSWINNSAPKVANSGSVIGITNTNAETSIMSTTIPASTIGTNGAIRGTVYVSEYSLSSAGLTIRAIYGGSSIATRVFTASAGQASVKGKIEYVLIGANSVSSQLGTLMVKMTKDRVNVSQSSVLGLDSFDTKQIYVDTGAAQTFGLTMQFSGTSAGDIFNTSGFTVDKLT